MSSSSLSVSRYFTANQHASAAKSTNSRSRPKSPQPQNAVVRVRRVDNSKTRTTAATATSEEERNNHQSMLLHHPPQQQQQQRQQQGYEQGDTVREGETNRPKPKRRPLNAYFRYCEEVRPKLKVENPIATPKEIMNKATEAYRALSENEKKCYKDKANAAMAKFKEEHGEEALKLGGSRKKVKKKRKSSSFGGMASAKNCSSQPQSTSQKSVSCDVSRTAPNASNDNGDEDRETNNICTKDLQPQMKQPKRDRTIKKQKQSTKATTIENTPKIVRLVKQKPIVKSPMFMTSPSSIYAAIGQYKSLMHALHGGDVCFDCNNAQNPNDDVVDEMLIIIHIHFGGCPIFEKEFDAQLSSYSATGSTDVLYPLLIEECLHRSVRHLCHHECFLRAYCGIREFTFFWRDMTINTTTVSDVGSPPHRFRAKKEHILAEWSCKILPVADTAATMLSPLPQSDANRKAGKAETRRLPLRFTSPEGMEFDTKAKAINFINKSFSSMVEQPKSPTNSPTSTSSLAQITTNSPQSTPLMDVATKLNPLFSPLGLIEELFLHDPWKLLVSTICLNVTTRAQVDRVLHQFLLRWPDATSTAKANWEEISSIISPLGLGTKRAKGLIRFSNEYLQLTKDHDAFNLTEKQVKHLFQVGQYGWTAYEVFILKELPKGSIEVCDHALQLYVEYQLGYRALKK